MGSFPQIFEEFLVVPEVLVRANKVHSWRRSLYRRISEIAARDL